MKNIALILLISIAMISCDKISDSPVAERETTEQEQNVEMAADATSDKDMVDEVKGNPVDTQVDLTNDDYKFDVDSKSQF
ncbi:MAG: hypothetical protein R6W67_09040 [Bacteroidales bacterium]